MQFVPTYLIDFFFARHQCKICIELSLFIMCVLTKRSTSLARLYRFTVSYRITTTRAQRANKCCSAAPPMSLRRAHRQRVRARRQWHSDECVQCSRAAVPQPRCIAAHIRSKLRERTSDGKKGFAYCVDKCCCSPMAIG